MDECKVILVEDSMDDASLFMLFVERENIEVQIKHFMDAESAYQFLTQSLESSEALDKALLMLDLNLPGMNGIELLAKLKDNGHEIPHTIVFSGSENPADKEMSLKMGAKIFQTKPWNPHGYQEFISGAFADELSKVCSDAS